MQEKKVKCSKCGYIGEHEEFPKGYDFFQHPYIRKCVKCDNWQSPGDASLRMMPGQKHPFMFIREEQTSDNPLENILYNAGEAS